MDFVAIPAPAGQQRGGETGEGAGLSPPRCGRAGGWQAAFACYRPWLSAAASELPQMPLPLRGVGLIPLLRLWCGIPCAGTAGPAGSGAACSALGEYNP